MIFEVQNSKDNIIFYGKDLVSFEVYRINMTIVGRKKFLHIESLSLRGEGMNSNAPCTFNC